MKVKLRSVEIGKDRPLELPDNVVPVRLEPIMEPYGVITRPSSDRFILYYLDRES